MPTVSQCLQQLTCLLVPTAADSVIVSTAADSVIVPTAADSVTVPTAADSVIVSTAADSDIVPTVADSVTVPTAADSVTVPTAADSVIVSTAADSVIVPTVADSVTVPTAADSVIVSTAAGSVIVSTVAVTHCILRLLVTDVSVCRQLLHDLCDLCPHLLVQVAQGLVVRHPGDEGVAQHLPGAGALGGVLGQALLDEVAELCGPLPRVDECRRLGACDLQEDPHGAHLVERRVHVSQL